MKYLLLLIAFITIPTSCFAEKTYKTFPECKQKLFGNFENVSFEKEKGSTEVSTHYSDIFKYTDSSAFIVACYKIKKGNNFNKTITETLDPMLESMLLPTFSNYKIERKSSILNNNIHGREFVVSGNDISKNNYLKITFKLLRESNLIYGIGMYNFSDKEESEEMKELYESLTRYE